jgi:hypothetical protein
LLAPRGDQWVDARGRPSGTTTGGAPSARLAPGSYRLAVTLDPEASARRLLEVSFAARTAPASP